MVAKEVQEDSFLEEDVKILAAAVWRLQQDRRRPQLCTEGQPAGRRDVCTRLRGKVGQSSGPQALHVEGLHVDGLHAECL